MRLPSPVEILDDPALFGLLSGFLGRLTLLSFHYFPSLRDLFASPLTFPARFHRFPQSSCIAPASESGLNGTAFNSDAASTHFDPCIQGHFVIFMVFSS